MNIGEVSAASGVSAKMIRYYEQVGLLAAASRSAAGYRRYAEADVRALQFLRRARSLGFSVAQMRELLTLWRDDRRASADVKRLALTQVAMLDAKAREIAEMSGALRHLAERCHGDDRPDCPIIDDLTTRGLTTGGLTTGGLTTGGASALMPRPDPPGRPPGACGAPPSPAPRTTPSHNRPGRNPPE